MSADPEVWAWWLAALGVSLVMIVGIVALLVWSFVIEPWLEWRRKQRRP